MDTFSGESTIDPVKGAKTVIQESIKNDTAVFAQVYADLKKIEQSDGLKLEGASGSHLDEFFQELPDASKKLVLESLQSRKRKGFQLDVRQGVRTPLPNNPLRLESIIRLKGRPSLWIRGDTWQDPKIEEITNRLNKAKSLLTQCFGSVGRIDGKTTMLGTGWLFAEDRLITNAHVADFFLSIKTGDELTYSLDDRADFDSGDAPDVNGQHAAALKDLLMYRPKKLDLAVFKLEWRDASQAKGPLTLDDKSDLEDLLDVAAIGYPKDDGREKKFDVLSNFQGADEVKRLSPGKIIDHSDGIHFQHDCSTLGGSSGSPIINLETGWVVGLHFSGRSRVANYAIKVEHLLDVLTK